MTDVEVKPISTIFERIEESGRCMNCNVSASDLVEEVIEGERTLTCPKCGAVHTEHWYQYNVPNPDNYKKAISWVLN